MAAIRFADYHTLGIIPLEQKKIETCIMCQNNQNWNYNTVYVYGKRGNDILHQWKMAAIWFSIIRICNDHIMHRNFGTNEDKNICKVSK